jgi:hypothetical protein
MHVLDHPRKISITTLLQNAPFHPFFLAAYPVVSLLGFNIDQVDTSEIVLSLFISLSATALVLIGLQLRFKNWQLAGLVTSLLVVWFFHYGRLYALLKEVRILGFLIGRHRYLLLVWMIAFTAAIFGLIKRKRVNPKWTPFLNFFSTILLCLPIFQIGVFYLRDYSPPEALTDSDVEPLISWMDDTSPPDIYYIVLDGYQRADVQENVFDIDITPFLDELRDLGFYVAECAQSNYTRTILSVTSTFNMDYIDSFRAEIDPDEKSAWLLPYYQHSVVRQQLESLGYQTIVFKTPWGKLVWKDASIVYKSSGTALLSPFEFMLLRTTLARVYLDFQQAESLKLSDYENYEDTRYALEQLPQVPDIPGPKFVFAHLVIPHSPFVFGPNGEYVSIPYDADAGNIYTEEDGKRGHNYAVTYINKMMLEILPEIIHNSKTPPIIIVSADHGSPNGGVENSVRILAAYYAPEAKSQFYATITPVNVFRIMFNTYFNTAFDLLPDRSYFSAQGQYFNFIEIPNTCGSAD